MTIGNWCLRAVIGIGSVRVECTFDVSYDGDIENLRVTDKKIDVTPYLAEPQLEKLERECYVLYMSLAKQHNDDLKINNYLAGAGQ